MTTTNRRTVLKAVAASGVGVAAAAISAPAIAQSAPEITWRLTSSFPKSLDTIYGAADVLAKAVAEATDNKFQIQVFAAGEIVPGLQALDAVSNGSVEMCHTCSFYFWGKDETFAFGTAMPFGFNCRMQNAWMYAGGGADLMNEFYAKHNVYGLPAGNTGAQMGGWYRKEITKAADLNGLKMRISGYAGKVIAKTGVVPQQIAGGDIYPALEKGTIDAAEWVGPYDDEKLGFYKVAPIYHYPGWWEGGPMLHAFVNLSKWNELPKAYKSIVANAAHRANEITMASYDAKNATALKKLLGSGAILKPFPRDVLEASFKATNEVLAESAAKNPNFKKVLDNWTQFRSDQYLWWQVTELGFDAFQVAAVNKRS